MRKAEHNDEIPFNPVAASFISEIMKLIVGILLCLRHPKQSFQELQDITLHDVGLFIIPAFLYVLTNNVRYFIIRAVNPGVVGVLWNLKIVGVALLYQLPPFKRRLSCRQWGGACLLVVGSLVAEYSQGSSTASDGGSNSGGLFGLLLVLGGLSLAASAGVSCEYAFKATAQTMGFPMQCSLLYVAGAVLNLAVFLAWGAEGLSKGSAASAAAAAGDGGSGGVSHSEGGNEGKAIIQQSEDGRFDLFAGFDAWAWAAVANISAVGFLIGLIFKYIDTVAQVRVVKGRATATATTTRARTKKLTRH